MIITRGLWQSLPATALRAVQTPGAGYLPAGTNVPLWSFPAIMGYSGGVIDDSRHELLVWGGGHGDYPGNEVIAVPYDGRPVYKVTEPSHYLSSGNQGVDTVDQLPDGRPDSRHSYDAHALIQDGGLDGFFHHGGSLWPGGYPVNGTWFFHRDQREWENLGPHPLWGESEYGATTLAACARYLPDIKKVFVRGRNFIAHYDPFARTWTKRGGAQWSDGEKTTVVDPIRFRIITVGARGGTGPIEAWDYRTGQPLALTFTGDVFWDAWAPGFVRDEIGDQYIAWKGGNTLYFINPDTLISKAVTVAGLAMPGMSPNGLGVFGRMGRSPSLDALVIVNDVDQDAFLLGFDRGGPTIVTPPPPTACPPTTGSPPPAPAPMGGLTIPSRIWLSYPLPAWDGSGQDASRITQLAGIADWDKHGSSAAHPADQRTYIAGGDYYGTSYRNEVWALDEVTVVALGTTVGAFELMWPYCGFPPAPQWPSGPDFISWYLRGQEFYLIPGEMQPHVLGTYGDACKSIPGSYDPATDTPPRYGIYAFDPTKPLAQRARLVGRNAGNHYETWRSPYDPVTDTFWRTGGAMNGGDCVALYHPTQDLWEEWFDTTRADWYFDNHLHQTSKCGKAIDVAGRALYCTDPRDRIFFRIHLDTRTLEHLGPLPGPNPMRMWDGSSVLNLDGSENTVIGDKTYLAFDDKNRIILFCDYTYDVYAYHVDTPAQLYNLPGFPGWEDLAGLPITGPGAARPIHINCVSFNPYRNVFVGFGPADFIYLFRYAEGVAGACPPAPPATVTLPVASAPVTVTIAPDASATLPPSSTTTTPVASAIVDTPISATTPPPDNSATHAADTAGAVAAPFSKLISTVSLGWLALKLLSAFAK